MDNFLTAADAWDFSKNKNSYNQLSDICDYILRSPILIEYHPRLVHMAAIVRPSIVSETLKKRILESMHKAEKPPVSAVGDLIRKHIKVCEICGADHLETYCKRKF